MIRKSILFFLLAIMLVACNAGATPAPTVDANAINTAAFSTAMAQISGQQTQTALAMPTNTPPPTNTVASLVTAALPTAGPASAASPTGNAAGALPTVSFNVTPNTTPLAGFTPVVGSPVAAGPTTSLGDACNNSSFVSDVTIPDGTVLPPGRNFDKVWAVQNTGTCTWDSTYSLVFKSGDLLDGLISYPIPGSVIPGETGDISIYLKAPPTTGTFTGYWHIVTPWNAPFGVGPLSSPFYVKIVATDAKKIKYGITSVTYEIVRNPEEGCPVNVRYTVYATITTNGPLELEYYWDQSDGNESGRKPMVFTEAGSNTISREWMVGRGDSPRPRWMQIIVTGPTLQYYDKAIWPNNCP